MERLDGPAYRCRPGERYDNFRRFLHELKRKGSTLLVTGEVPPRVRALATRQLLGMQNVNPTRQRVLLWVDTELSLTACLPRGVDPTDECVRLITVPEFVRADCASDEPSSDAELSSSVSCPIHSATTTIPNTDEDVSSVERAVSDAIAELTEGVDTNSPGVIRVGLISLEFLCDRLEPRAAVELCESIRAEMHACAGLAHFHLPVPDDDALVNTFADVVDARIELRDRDGLVPEQRWHTFHAVKNNPGWIQL